jgi:phage terminase large subunit
MPDGAQQGFEFTSFRHTKPSLNPALKPFWDTNVDATGKKVRIRVLYGGRASSKTWDACGRLVYMTDNAHLRICCCRQFQNKLSESVQPVIVDTIDRFGLGKRFDPGESKIVNKYTRSEFLFYGIWRQIREIKGLEGIDIFLIEEAEALTQEQWLIIEATARKRGAQIWIIFNPYLATDFVYQNFVINPPPRTLVRMINYDENPFLAPDFIETIMELKARDFEEYQHIYLGVPKSDEETAVIKRSWIMAAIDAHLALDITGRGAHRIGYDVADEGPDYNAMVYAHMPLVSWADEWKGGELELLKSSTRVWNRARERSAHVIYDNIGMGAFVGAKLNELNHAAFTDKQGNIDYARFVTHRGFNASGAVWHPDSKYLDTNKTNAEMFANLKAQAWWMAGNRFQNTANAIRHGHKFRDDQLICIASDTPYLPKLITELSTPKRDFDQNGRVKVESKKDMAKPTRVGGPAPSTNLADAFVMVCAPGMDPMRISAAALQNT